jgi:glycyl-tRNA synthetase
MPEKKPTRFDKIIELSVKRGFFYPAFEIYGSTAGFYTYGSVGLRVKRNWENLWRKFFVQDAVERFVEIQAPDVMPEPVFRASGHLQNFLDPVVVCKKCGFTERADTLIEEVLKERFEGKSEQELDSIIRKHNIKCPQCKGELKEVGRLNLMFGFGLGAEASNRGFLRPETAQGSYVSFLREYKINRERLPLGLAIVGKAYRNEIAPRQALIRMREFTQAEIQIFFDPQTMDYEPYQEVADNKVLVLFSGEKKERLVSVSEIAKHTNSQLYCYYLAKVAEFYQKLGIKVRFTEIGKEERAFYNKIQFDIEAYIEAFDAWKEVMGLHYRGDHDLSGHEKISKQNMSIAKDGRRFIPHVLELSFGVDRNVFALLDSVFKEGKEGPYFALPPNLAPNLVGVYPLVSKDGLGQKAEEIFSSLRSHFDVIFDDGGSIGRRYARSDEIGVPFGITVDYDSMKNHDVTLRDRDSTKQIRVKITELPSILHRLLNGEKFSKISP